eukprot:CAMPEP_0206613490 /NCGR_PEP_ID=MMETSP0325_2-20121206/56740_1 /ASSEMBLY_ACC=CAM_ASM_000347 /TAXON_ID=2866 /ORGANISM="Crypthecodinium cohnii, Strain Seligo" /LENGTH=570 /DNA_ID=CAMNT_0054133631 /DNA_START=46 /DNA_END=1758 /DNA_ORIENTATION=+
MGVTYDQPTISRICDRLRKLVQDAFQRHLYSSAVFYADKCFALSNYSPEDLYTLAECYFMNREYRRVLRLLKEHESVGANDDRLKLLVAQCLLECKEYEECLKFIENLTESAPNASLTASFELLRGRLHEVTENHKEAVACYTRVADLDPYCHEALDRLIGSHVLPMAEEVDLLKGLAFHPEDEWLRHLYAAKLAAVRTTSATSQDSLGSLPTPSDTSQPVPRPENVVADVAPESIWWGTGRKRRLRAAAAGKPAGVDEKLASVLPAALVRNGQTLAAQATKFFYEGDYESCYEVSKRVLESDQFHLGALPVHIASLVMLNKKSVVFYVAHNLVNAQPNSSVAWFSVGCYYFMVKKYQQARRFFNKALALENAFAPAWIAYGHAFALQKESDQALAAYRTASRLFPGSHLPWLFIGVEYMRTNSLPLAQQCLEYARTLMPTDPQIYNELGVAAFQRRDYPEAVHLLQRAAELSCVPDDTVCTNLGHAFLKAQALDHALESFKQARKMAPQNSSALCGIAFTLQLSNKPCEAIDYYHRCLSINREDQFAIEMLNQAAQEAATQMAIDMDLC